MRSYYEPFMKKVYTNYNNSSYSFDSHFHDKMELAHCFRGEQLVIVGDTLYTLRQGDTILIFPNVVHEYIKSGVEDTESISLIGECDFLAVMLPDIISKRARDPFLPAEKLPDDAKRGFERFRGDYQESELMGWTLIILSAILKKTELIPIKESGEAGLAPSIINYINTNFQKELTIKYLAGEFGYSASYIAHIFYDQLKIPFRTYLGKVRSQFAAELILKTNKSLTDIAYDSGYNSINTFCRSFKKSFDMTPSEYRKKRKKQV